jgi:hypothetical protein
MKVDEDRMESIIEIIKENGALSVEKYWEEYKVIIFNLEYFHNCINSIIKGQSFRILHYI